MKTRFFQFILMGNILLFAMGSIGCAGVFFGEEKPTSSPAVTTSGTTDNDGPDGPNDTPAVLPAVSDELPPCRYNSNCEMVFKLAAPMPHEFSFHWVTNDLHINMSTPTAPKVLGEPNVDYIPKNADVVFLPGETEKHDFVVDINSDPARSLVIGLIYSQCTYNGEIRRCTEFFR